MCYKCKSSFCKKLLSGRKQKLKQYLIFLQFHMKTKKNMKTFERPCLYQHFSLGGGGSKQRFSLKKLAPNKLMSYQTRVTEVCQREREITKIYTPWSQDIMYTPDRGKEKYAHIYLLNSYIPFTDKPMQYISSTMHIIAFWDVQAFSLPSRKHLTQYNVNRKSFFLYIFPPPPSAKLFEEKLFLKSQQSP